MPEVMATPHPLDTRAHTAPEPSRNTMLRHGIIMTDLTASDGTLFEPHLNGLNHRKN